MIKTSIGFEPVKLRVEAMSNTQLWRRRQDHLNEVSYRIAFKIERIDGVLFQQLKTLTLKALNFESVWLTGSVSKQRGFAPL